MLGQIRDTISISQTQICEQCHLEFHASHVQRFHSQDCYWASLRTLPDVTCPQCGKVFHPKVYAGKLQVCCSDDCRIKFYVGPKHPNWTGGKSLEKNGYVRVNIGPNKRDREHRVVMASQIGRTLRSDEHVHHKNEKKAQNDLGNLEILTPQVHKRLHGKSQPRRPPIVCRRCGKRRKHGAKGYCKPCYTRVNLEERIARDPEGMRVRLQQMHHESYIRKKERRQKTP